MNYLNGKSAKNQHKWMSTYFMCSSLTEQGGYVLLLYAVCPLNEHHIDWSPPVVHQ